MSKVVGISLSVGNNNVSINPVGVRAVQAGQAVDISVKPFLDDYDVRIKTNNLANEARRPNAQAMLSMTATVGNSMVERCVNMHNNEHRGSTAVAGAFYEEMVQAMLIDGEYVITNKDHKRAVLPFKTANVVSRAGDSLKSFSFQGTVVITNRRIIIVAANPSQGGDVNKGAVIPRPTCLDACGKIFSCGMYDPNKGERRYVLNYSVSENMVFWSAPLKDFKSGFELRISQGVQILNTMSSHLTCCDRTLGALCGCCCCTTRVYQQADLEAVLTTNTRTLSLPFLFPPWEDKATLLLHLPTLSDNTLSGDAVTNADIQNFLEQFQSAARDAGATLV